MASSTEDFSVTPRKLAIRKPKLGRKQKHKRNHQGRLSCPSCDKTFQDRSGLSKHSKFHSDKCPKEMMESLLEPTSSILPLNRLEFIRRQRDALVGISPPGLAAISSVDHIRLVEAAMYIAHFSPGYQRLSIMEKVLKFSGSDEASLELQLIVLLGYTDIPAIAGKFLQELVLDKRSGRIMVSERFKMNVPGNLTPNNLGNLSQIKHALVAESEKLIPKEVRSDYLFAIKTGCKRVLPLSNKLFAVPKTDIFDKSKWEKRTMRPDIVAYMPFYGDPVDRQFFYTVWNSVVPDSILYIYRACLPLASKNPKTAKFNPFVCL